MLFTSSSSLGLLKYEQTQEVETEAFVFTDFTAITTFGNSPYDVKLHLKNDTDEYDRTYSATEFPTGTEYRGSMLAHAQSLIDSHIIELTVDGQAELLDIIENMPIYRTGAIGNDLRQRPINYTLKSIDFQPAGSVGTGIGGVPHGRQINDIWNQNGSTIPYSTGDLVFDMKAYWEFPLLFNIMQKSIDDGLIDPSDELREFIDENLVAISTDTSFHWDIYINSFRASGLKGGYVTNSIVVRWSCPAVNKATEEYLEQDPEYEIRADNTLIELSADKTRNQGVGKPPFFSCLYGELQTKITMDKLSSVIGTNAFMKNISGFIPSTNLGDCYLYLNRKWGTAGATDLCIAQIPLNSATQNADHLWVKNGSYGSTVTIHYGEPQQGVDDDVVGWNDDVRDGGFDSFKEDDYFRTDTDENSFTTDISSKNSNIGVLTTSYAMSESNLRGLGYKLWSSSFLDEISMINNSPIENIISCKSFGFPISGTSANVKLGNVNMNVEGLKISSDYTPVKTIGSFTVQKKFSGHLEWLNYQTNVRIYLPYIGFQELDIVEVLNKEVTVKYIYDIITGVCTACLYAKSDGIQIEIAKYSGNMAIDIPITASNRAQVETGYIASGLGALGSLLTGNVVGGIMSVFGGLTNQNHFTTKGSPSPSCDAFDEQKVFIIIDYPVYYEPTNYAHDYGYPCNMAKTLGNCKGFTKCLNVDVDNIVCTEFERAEIKRLLESGVYL